jgi:hydroxymethylglutaryl-CoA lyase
VTDLRFPPSVRLVEVGPRDGLQNEAAFVPTESKARWIGMLIDAGLREIEATSFVAPARVPQLADAEELMALLPAPKGVRYAALVPNEQGLERARHAGLETVAVFTAASESFTRHNIGCGIDESLARFAPVVEESHRQGLRVRAYVSTVIGCPYEGPVRPERVRDVCARLLELAVDEISLGDTIGVGTPASTLALLRAVADTVALDRLAVHFHDTYGTALANICAALDYGVTIVDCATGGLGGCPYAPGARGNVATEDVVYLLEGSGVRTGVNLPRLLEAVDYIAAVLGHAPRSRTAQVPRGRLWWPPPTSAPER